MTDTTPPADQSQDQGQQTTGGAAAPAGKVLVEANFERAFTQKSQTLAALAKELGIPRDADAEDFIAAINARSEAAQVVEEPDETPEMAKRRRELDQHAWDLAQERYGPEMAGRAREFFDSKIRRDPLRAVAAFNAAVLEMAQLRTAGANSGTEQAQPAGQQPGQGESFPELGQAPSGATPPQPPNPEAFKGNPTGMARAILDFAQSRRSR